MPGVPTKRSFGASGATPHSADQTRCRPSQTSTQPLSLHSRTAPANSAVLGLKYCAPWSNWYASARRVLMRPPGPRPASKTVTSWDALKSRATVALAMPEPCTATRSALADMTTRQAR